MDPVDGDRAMIGYGEGQRTDWRKEESTVFCASGLNGMCHSTGIFKEGILLLKFEYHGQSANLLT
jgi:hypothetical protein